MHSEKIIIQFPSFSMEAEIMPTTTGNAILCALPLSGKAHIWGDEIYFGIPLSLAPEKEAKEEVSIGDLGYWPIGKAFCIFFGRTPVSTDNNPKAYSAVNVFGKITGDCSMLKKVRQGDIITIQKK